MLIVLMRLLGSVHGSGRHVNEHVDRLLPGWSGSGAADECSYTVTWSKLVLCS